MSINDPAALLLCPIKAVLNMALRLGNVRDAITVHDLLTRTAARRDKTVQWKDPYRPVLVAFTGRGAKVVATKPANSKQVCQILSEAALNVGIVGKVRPHDLRRGAAKDIRNITVPSANAVNATADLGSVQSLLVHSHDSLRRGVTKKHVGAEDNDLWVPRVETNHQVVMSMPLVAAKEDVFKYPSYSSKAIDTFCAKYKLDASLKTDRLKATRWANKEALDSWIERNAMPQ